jgi:hypothetical protein
MALFAVEINIVEGLWNLTFAELHSCSIQTVSMAYISQRICSWTLANILLVDGWYRTECLLVVCEFGCYPFCGFHPFSWPEWPLLSFAYAAYKPQRWRISVRVYAVGLWQTFHCSISVWVAPNWMLIGCLWVWAPFHLWVSFVLMVWVTFAELHSCSIQTALMVNISQHECSWTLGNIPLFRWWMGGTKQNVYWLFVSLVPSLLWVSFVLMVRVTLTELHLYSIQPPTMTNISQRICSWT